MNLYNRTTFACSKIVTVNYSTSFSLGIKVLANKFHDPIYGIYGLVRFADEIVDTFHEHDKERLLANFKSDTYRAIEDKISLNPILNSFQKVVNEYSIDQDLIEAFFRSMEMDLNKISYDDQKYDEYIYGSAEVVGLMCLHIFCEGNMEMFRKLESPARKLGAAFQKVNFLRDLNSDFEERGRVYFPGLDLENFDSFSDEIKRKIEADIQEDFKEAYNGIQRLPHSARSGVYLAYIYYLKLFSKIRSCPASKILERRIRVPDIQKLTLLIRTYFQFKVPVYNSSVELTDSI